MMEITKDGINYEINADKYYKKRVKSGFTKRIFDENKILMYLLRAFFIFTIANATLIYSFFKILAKL